MSSSNLLCLYELGYMELDRRGAELLFQVLTEHEERSAVAIASNEPFLVPGLAPGRARTVPPPWPVPVSPNWLSAGPKTFIAPPLVDQLTFDGQIIETGMGNHRLADARRTRSR